VKGLRHAAPSGTIAIRVRRAQSFSREGSRDRGSIGERRSTVATIVSFDVTRHSSGVAYSPRAGDRSRRVGDGHHVAAHVPRVAGDVAARRPSTRLACRAIAVARTAGPRSAEHRRWLLLWTDLLLDAVDVR